MSVIDIGGLPSLSADELEKIAELLETKAEEYLRSKRLFSLLSDLSLTVILSQDSSNLLTLTLDLDFTGPLSSDELRAIQSDLFDYLSQVLRDELLCKKK